MKLILTDKDQNPIFAREINREVGLFSRLGDVIILGDMVFKRRDAEYEGFMFFDQIRIDPVVVTADMNRIDKFKPEDLSPYGNDEDTSTDDEDEEPTALQIVSEVLSTYEDDDGSSLVVTLDKEFIKDYEFSTQDLRDIADEIESDYDIDISHAEVIECITVGDLMKLIDLKWANEAVEESE